MEFKRKEQYTHLKENKMGDLLYLSFPELEKQEGFLHGFSTRLGGVSQNELSSMNLSFSRGDDPANVRENFFRMVKAIGFSAEKLVFSDQTHTTNVRKITEEDAGKGFLIARDYQDIDGLITNVPGIVLATFYADCVPLYFIDPVRKCIGLSHSGWKGTVNNIAAQTVHMMKAEYGTDPSDLVCAIGPSICQDCYEVSEDVIEQFRDRYKEKDWADLFYQKENGKYQLNLWAACKKNLVYAGVREGAIAVTDICTCCNPQVLFSHRASKGKRGNLGAFLGIRER